MFKLDTIQEWLKGYSTDINIIDDEICFSFSDMRIWLKVDTFTHTAILSAEVFDYGVHDDDEEECIYSGEELANVMTANMYPYAFVWDDINRTINARKIFSFNNDTALEFLLKVEIVRMFYLGQQAEKVFFVGKNTDFPDDENWMQFLLKVIDKWVAGDILNLSILYLHGFASSGNSGTAKEIQECLPNCKVISPDMPIHPSEALELIHKIVDEQEIDLVIGTSMGGYFAAQISGKLKILVNPSFHVSRMMKSRLGDNYEMTIPYFKTREDGATEFVLTKEIANWYFALERNIGKSAAWSNRSKIETLGVFGTDDDVVDCREEYLSMYDNIRFFKGGHRLDKEAVEEVIIPSILQMVINERTL